MRIVALEEHYTIPSLVARIPPDAIRRRGFPPPDQMPQNTGQRPSKLMEIGSMRIADMDASGISLQVLSLSGPGADLLPADEGVPWAREANDILAQSIVAHPARFAGFAHLPLTAPEAAADELERCVRTHGFVGALVSGMTQDKFLDSPEFEPVLARAEQLDVPIYIHPNIPPESVRRAYYDNLPPPLDFLLSIAGWGWHAETAVHVLRLILSGALDRHPRLKIIIGHMGEGLPMMVDRTSSVFEHEGTKYLSRSVAETLRDQVHVTTSGQFTIPPLMALIATFGIDNVLFSVDYPFSANETGRRFLDSLPLAPSDINKIAHGNADRLLKLRDV